MKTFCFARRGSVVQKARSEAARRIDEAIKRILDEFEFDGARRKAFLRLIEVVQLRTSLLKRTRDHHPSLTPLFVLRRLGNFAARQAFWLPPCEAWHPESASPREICRSLAQHLLGKYATPRWLDAAWDQPLGAAGFREQSWYIRVARGAALRSLNLPIVLTRRMEHYARLAPDHYTCVQALRHGEVLGLGAGEALAREVVTTRLGRETENSGFWRTVLLFLANQPGFRSGEVGALIDFIYSNKFAGEDVFTANGLAQRPAPWPDFSMEGRSVAALLRLIAPWRKEGGSDDSSAAAWHPLGISGFRWLELKEAEEFDWSIVELLSSSSLRNEGVAMHHCVASYAPACSRRLSSIWSLRLRTAEREKRIATIEIDPRKRAIVQIKAKCNRRPSPRALRIIEKWADETELKVSL